MYYTKLTFYYLAIFSFVLAYIAPTYSQGQENLENKFGKNEQKCRENLSIYTENYKRKDYKQAYSAWLYCYDNCPKSTINIYIHGLKILLDKEKKAKNANEKEKYAKLIIDMFDKRMKYFNKSNTCMLGEKGKFMIRLFKNDSIKEAGYKIIDKAIKLSYKSSCDSLKNIKDPKFIKEYINNSVSETAQYSLFIYSLKRYSQSIKKKNATISKLVNEANSLNAKRDNLKNRKKIEQIDTKVANINKQIQDISQSDSKLLNDVFKDYTKITNLNDFIMCSLETLGKNTNDPKLKKTIKNKKQYINKIQTNLNVNLAKIGDCKKYNEFFEKEINKQAKLDKKELDNNRFSDNFISKIELAVAILSKSKCTKTDAYFKALEYHSIIHNCPICNNGIARLYLNKGNVDKAIKSYLKVTELEKDSIKKSKIFVKLSQIYLSKKNNKKQAYKYIQKSLQFNPKSGEAYLLLGNIYANSANECGSNTFEKRAVYWLAIDNFRLTKKLNPSLSSKVNKLINRYSKLTPDKDLIFQFGYTGKKSYKIKCWINKVVAIPQ